MGTNPGHYIPNWYGHILFNRDILAIVLSNVLKICALDVPILCIILWNVIFYFLKNWIEDNFPVFFFDDWLEQKWKEHCEKEKEK